MAAYRVDGLDGAAGGRGLAEEELAHADNRDGGLAHVKNRADLRVGHDFGEVEGCGGVCHDNHLWSNA